MGRITRRAADKIKRTVQIVQGLESKGAGFAKVGPQFLLAKTTTDHLEDSIEDVDIYAGGKGEEVYSGQTVKAYNRRGDISEDEWIHIQWVGGGWEIVGGGGAVRLIGPCATYTPDGADPDTDFEEPYPSSCDGPDVYGVNVTDVTNGTITVVRLEKISTGPLTMESDSFSLTCVGGSVSCYINAVFNSLSTGGVVAEIRKVSDDSVVQEYTNSIYSWNPLAGGNLQMGPDGTTVCVCTTVPYQLCFAVPTR